MPKKSKRVIRERESSHKSKLIIAGERFGDIEDDLLSPQGTWGSTAKITFSANKITGNNAVYHNITINSSELDFEFEVPFDDNLEANEGEIIVYNLSDSTLNALNSIAKYDDHSVTIEAGYEGDTGVIYKGYITKISTKRENADRVTTIMVTDTVEDRTLNITYSGVTASHILSNLIDMVNRPKATYKTIRDFTYENDVTIDESLSSAIKKYSEVCGVSTFVSRGFLYCCKIREVDNTSIFDVSENTGMIGSPVPFVEEVASLEEEYNDKIEGVEVEMLLQHRLSTGAEIRLTSEQYNGKYYVKSGTHTFNESECKTTFKAIR